MTEQLIQTYQKLCNIFKKRNKSLDKMNKLLMHINILNLKLFSLVIGGFFMTTLKASQFSLT